jgi:nickel/cobalt transporter (NicO) family protein
MDQFQHLAQQGGLHAWIFLPTALVLGALHGLEPGHSKTMMAAFIIAIRGTIAQAVLLGLCAAFSHSLLIWVLALAALHFGSQWSAEGTEPYFQLISSVLIIGLGLWMAWRTRRDVQAEHDHHHAHDHDHHHDHDHTHDTSGGEYQDAHERAHAVDIEQRFSGGKASTGQIALFGLTGGLLPCPAAFTVVLVCLQLKRFALGIGMVAAFSVGLAFTLVAAGVLAAWGMRHAQKRFSGLGAMARKLPYVSSLILVLMGLFIGFEGWRHLATHP